MYYIYMLRCEGNTLYTGITTDLERRMSEHFEQTEKGAKYTHSHLAQKVEAVWKSDGRKNASKLEYSIKRLTKAQKERLIKDNSKFEEYLSGKLDVNSFERMI